MRLEVTCSVKLNQATEGNTLREANNKGRTVPYHKFWPKFCMITTYEIYGKVLYVWQR
jgi:hypothetical protein